MSGPSGKHRSPRRLLGGWAQEDLALTDEAARSVGESWSEWMRRVAIDAAREELEAPESRALRAPRPPEELVGALQDRVHPTSGRLLAAKPITTTRRK